MLAKWLQSSTKRIQVWFLLTMVIALCSVGCIQPKSMQTANSPSKSTSGAPIQPATTEQKDDTLTISINTPSVSRDIVTAQSLTVGTLQIIPQQPTTACANGQPWQYHPNNVKYPWQCPLMNSCANRCTENAGAPAGKKCVGAGNKDDGTPIINIVAPFHTWTDLLAQRDKNGYKCSWSIRYYPGEWPLGDPRNLIVVLPVASPEIELLRTQLLPLR